MTLASLRGVRTRARVLVAVAIAFLVVITILVVAGSLNGPEIPSAAPVAQTSIWPVIIAFAGAIAAGSVMMTGIESLAASGPFHEAPQGVRAGSHAAHRRFGRCGRVLRPQLACVALLDLRLARRTGRAPGVGRGVLVTRAHLDHRDRVRVDSLRRSVGRFQAVCRAQLAPCRRQLPPAPARDAQRPPRVPRWGAYRGHRVGRGGARREGKPPATHSHVRHWRLYVDRAEPGRDGAPHDREDRPRDRAARVAPPWGAACVARGCRWRQPRASGSWSRCSTSSTAPGSRLDSW